MTSKNQIYDKMIQEILCRSSRKKWLCKRQRLYLVIQIRHM